MGEEDLYLRFEEARQRAIVNRDLGAYIQACSQLGITPEPEVQEALDSGLSPQQESVLRQQLEKVSKRIGLRRKYSELSGYTNEHEINTEHPEEKDIAWMRRGLIDVMGYTKLRCHGSEKVLTRDAKPSRVIETYRSCIRRAVK